MKSSSEDIVIGVLLFLNTIPTGVNTETMIIAVIKSHQNERLRRRFLISIIPSYKICILYLINISSRNLKKEKKCHLFFLLAITQNIVNPNTANSGSRNVKPKVKVFPELDFSIAIFIWSDVLTPPIFIL